MAKKKKTKKKAPKRKEVDARKDVVEPSFDWKKDTCQGDVVLVQLQGRVVGIDHAGEALVVKGKLGVSRIVMDGEVDIQIVERDEERRILETNIGLRNAR